MIRLNFTIDSLILHEPITIQVAMPQLLSFSDVKLKVVYGLHCLCSDSDIFFRRLCIEDYVEKYNVAFISTNLSNSYYLNSRLNNVADFLDFEFYPYLKTILPISDKKEDNFCLGVSMGAFGALAWALRQPSFFNKIACISGYYDFNLGISEGLKKQRNSYALTKICRPYMQDAFTGGFENINTSLSLGKDSEISYDKFQESANLIKLIEKAEPKTFAVDFYCGNQDEISLKQSKFFFERVKERGFNTSYAEVEGLHDVYTWRNALAIAFKSLINAKDK